MAVIMALMFTSFASKLGRITSSDKLQSGITLSDRAEQFAKDRSRFVADRAIRTTMRNLERKSEKWRAKTDKGIDVPASEIAEAAKTEFGSSRIQTIATTETTKVRTEGEREGAFVRFGTDTLQIWTLGPCQHCSFCPLVAGTDISCWGDVVDGPPAHVNCCCSIRFIAGGQYQRACPPRSSLMQSAKDSGLFGL